MQRVVLAESTRNLLSEGLFEPFIIEVPGENNINGIFKNILADHYYSHSNFKKRQGQNQQQTTCYTTCF